MLPTRRTNVSYIFIAHKPYSDYSCWGSIAEQYPAVFIHEATDDLNRVIDLWADCLVHNNNLPHGDEPYEVDIYVGNPIKDKNAVFQTALELSDVKAKAAEQAAIKKAEEDVTQRAIDKKAHMEKEYERLKKELGK